MAEQDPNQGKPAPFKELADDLSLRLFSIGNLGRLGKTLTNTIGDAFEVVIAFLLKSAGAIGVFIATELADAEDRAEPAFGKLAATAVKDLFGVDVSEGAMTGRGNRGGRKQAADAIGGAVLRAITGTAGGGAAGQLQPGTKAAEDYLSFVVQMGLEGWLEGWIVEALSLGQLERFGDLDDIMAQSLGLGRITARIVRPMLNTLVVTPMQWQIDKTYRPQLLSAAAAVRQYHRGRYTREQLVEELARQGWSDGRIDALVNESTKFLGEADVEHLVFVSSLAFDVGVEKLKSIGYSDETARAALQVAGDKRLAAVYLRIARAAVDAYVNRDIERGDLDALLRANVNYEPERAALIEEAEFGRQFTRKRLSLSDMENAVKRGIRDARDYRNLARDLGYEEEDVLTLELLLQAEMQGQREAAAAKRAAEEAAAREKAAKAAEAAKRKTELELARSRTLPSLAQVERAVVRGILPIDRYAAQLRAEKYVEADIAFLVELVAQAREQFLDDEERRDEAERRAAQQELAIGTLERAVERGILAIEEYAEQLRSRNFDGDQVRILTSLLQARLDDLAADRARRAALEREASTRGIALADLVRAVRRGIRTIADYETALEAAGFAASDVATLVALLRDELARDAEARAEKDRAQAAAAARGVSLETIARAVKLGVRDRDDYAAALLEAKLAPEAQLVLLDLLDAEIASAARARELRAGAVGVDQAKVLPLSQVEAAVKAGVRTVNDYLAAAIEAGYRESDVELLIDLLVAELQAKQQSGG